MRMIGIGQRSAAIQRLEGFSPPSALEDNRTTHANSSFFGCQVQDIVDRTEKIEATLYSVRSQGRVSTVKVARGQRRD